MAKNKIIGNNILNGIPYFKAAGRYDRYMKVIKTGKTFITDDLFSHPEFGDIYLSVKALKVGDGMGVIITDITERKQAEKALRKSEERFRTIYENAPVMMESIDENGRCILWNKECEETFGWTMEEINTYDDPISLLYPDPKVRRRVRDTVTTKPGGVFKKWHPVMKDGRERIQLWANFRIDEGIVINIGYDITELKILEDQLVRSERLAATGQLAASIAHEINSPLQGIISLLSSIGRTYKQDKKLLKELYLIRMAFNSIRDTVRKLLDLNSPGKEATQEININNVIKDTMSLLKSLLIKNKVKVNLRLSSKIPNINASPQQFKQIFINLINNAAEAMTEVSKIRDKKRAGVLINREITINTWHKDNNIIIKVANTGPSIPEKDIKHIFDPFFTRKKKLGMGIGLSICHGLIKAYNGSITANNSPERGTAFIITLPVN